jgi:hypothetical protein
MGVVYADRGFISVNGVEVLDVENISVKQTDGTKPVPTMTRNRRTKGFVKGNREFTISFAVAVQNALGTPKIESIDFENNSVALTFEHGADRYSLTNLDFADAEQGASGVGSEGKKSFNMVATDMVDQVGNSALFPTVLSNAAN